MNIAAPVAKLTDKRICGNSAARQSLSGLH